MKDIKRRSKHEPVAYITGYKDFCDITLRVNKNTLIPRGDTEILVLESLKELKNNGVLLNVNSKNDYDNAIMGINNSKSVLSVDDFIVIKANFEPKVVNNNNISQELNIPVKQLVYLDDSFEERNSVREAMPLMGVPEFTSPHEYIKILDRNEPQKTLGLLLFALRDLAIGTMSLGSGYSIGKGIIDISKIIVNAVKVEQSATIVYESGCGKTTGEANLIKDALKSLKGGCE